MNFISINPDFSPEVGYIYLFFFTIAVIWIVLFLFSLKSNGLRLSVRHFFPMMVAALFIEASGVSSGRFVYPNYFLYFSVLGGQVPLIILLGWSTNLYLFLHLGRTIVKKVWIKTNSVQLLLIAACAGLIGICLDLLEDPVAHHNQWWVWTESSAVTFLHVPVSNFVDWFFILFFMALCTLYIDRLSCDENRKVILSFTLLPVVFLFILLAHHTALIFI